MKCTHCDDKATAFYSTQHGSVHARSVQNLPTGTGVVILGWLCPDHALRLTGTAWKLSESGRP